MAGNQLRWLGADYSPSMNPSFRGDKFSAFWHHQFRVFEVFFDVSTIFDWLTHPPNLYSANRVANVSKASQKQFRWSDLSFSTNLVPTFTSLGKLGHCTCWCIQNYNQKQGMAGNQLRWLEADYSPSSFRGDKFCAFGMTIFVFLRCFSTLQRYLIG